MVPNWGLRSKDILKSRGASNDISIALWVKSNNPGEELTISRPANSNGGLGIIIQTGQHNRVRFVFYNQSEDDTRFNQIKARIPNSNEWLHIAMTFKATEAPDEKGNIKGNVKLYINSALTTESQLIYNPEEGRAFALGGRGSKYLFTKISIDEFFTFDHVLTETQVKHFFELNYNFDFSKKD